MPISFINLPAQYQSYKEEIDSEIQSVLNSSSYIMGEKLQQFEQMMAKFTGVKHAIGCSNGSDALLLPMMAMEIGRGDEVITSPFTFIATAEMISLLGAKPVFVDIDKETYNIDPAKIEACITEHTKAIMPVSLFGQCADMTAINNIADKYKLPVIEDAAQSFGAEQNAKKSGALTKVGSTSFFPAKPLGCYGDGGAMFTDDCELAEKLRILLNHGQTAKYIHSHIGINGRLDTIQAAILSVKLRYFPNEIEKRNQLAARYSSALKNCILPKINDGNISVWAQYCVRIPNRTKIIEFLQNRGIPTAIYYPIPLHLQQVFKYLGYAQGDFPIAEKVANDIMALPFSPFLAEQEQEFIISSFNEITKNKT